MKVKSESEVAQSCLTPSDPMDCSLPGSSIHGILQARVLEWGAISFSGIQKGRKKTHILQVTGESDSCSVKSDSETPQDSILPGSSGHGGLRARILECVAMPFPGGSSRPRDQNGASCIDRQIL